MNYLAIDTSGKNLTVLICKDGKVYKFFDAECGVSHSVSLMPEIENLAKKANFDFRKADFFCAVTGAGSFTGIRIVVSTIKAMCFAYKKPALAITSFDTLAYNETKGKVLALIDAKHNGFYACGYVDGKIEIQPCYIMREQVEDLLKEYKGVCATKVDGLNLQNADLVKGLELAINAKLDCISNDAECLTPLYVRKSQAEEGR